MRVAVYYNNRDVRIEERPVPKIGPGELLMRIRASGICGSDVMEWYRTAKAPCVLGHEVAGEIVEIGPGIDILKKGDRISASHHVPCYNCHYCQLGHHTLCDTLRTTNFEPGGFAEWVRLPEINSRYGVYRIPDTVSFEEATFVEPLACVVRAQQKVNVRKGQTVLVIGCGVSGLLHVMVAKTRGATKIFACDLIDSRMEVALQCGANEVFKASDNIPKKLSLTNEGRLADVVIVCAVNKEATLQAIECAGRGGVVLFFALQSPDQVIPFSMNEVFWQKGLTFTSSYAASPEDHRESLDLICSRKVNVSQLITHRLGLSEVAKGFNLVMNARDSIKVILDPSR